MIRQLVVLAVAAIYLAGSTTAQSHDVPLTDAEKHEAQVYSDLLLSHFYLDKSIDPKIKENAANFNFEKAKEIWLNKTVIEHFEHMYENGMLPFDHLFSLFNVHHLEEVKALFDVFYYAPSYVTFKEFASWARIHINPEMFVYVYNVAIIHGKHTKFIHLRPLYEVLLYSFFNNDYLMAHGTRMVDIMNGNVTGTTVDIEEPIYAPYTHTYITNTRDPETRLTYFFEDVGVNWRYYYNHLLTPFWMSSSQYPIPTYRGWLFAFTTKWMYSRFEMERYSHHMKPMEFIDWNQPIMTGYTPIMTHSNGILFPQRKEWSNVSPELYELLELLLGYEKRVGEALDFGYVAGTDGKFIPITDDVKGMNVAANLIEGNADMPNPTFYGSIDHFGRRILGSSPLPKDQYHVLPSALDSYMTSCRDPGFFRHIYRLKYFMDKYTKHISFPSPTTESYSITSFKVSRVTTYFESYVFPVSNVTAPDGSTVIIKANQTRLNCKDFKYYYDIQAKKDVKVQVNIFVGPPSEIANKFTPKDMDKFYLVDSFPHALVAGQNKFERKFTDSSIGVPDYDWTSSGKGTTPRPGYGWPLHMLFPKGTYKGLPAVFYVHITTIPNQEDTSSSVPFPFNFFELDKSWNTPFFLPLEYHYKNLFSFHIYHEDELHSNLTI